MNEKQKKKKKKKRNLFGSTLVIGIKNIHSYDAVFNMYLHFKYNIKKKTKLEKKKTILTVFSYSNCRRFRFSKNNFYVNWKLCVNN